MFPELSAEEKKESSRQTSSIIKFSNQILSEYDKVLWEYLGSELKTSTLLLKLAHYRILLNFVIDRASRNKNIKNMISGMLADEVPKTELSNPMFYLKTLFS